MKKLFAIIALVSSLAAIGCDSPATTTKKQAAPSPCELANPVFTTDWNFSETANVMDRSTVSVGRSGGVIIRCRGESLSQDPFCKKGKLEAYVSTKDIVNDESPTLRVRFDEGKPERQTWSRSTDYRALFAPNPRQFVSRILKSKEFFIEYAPYEKIAETLHFDIKGFAEAATSSRANSFLRGLTRERVVSVCGPGIEETSAVRVDLSYPPTSSEHTGVKFEFSTYGDDIGKIVSAETMDGHKWYAPAVTTEDQSSAVTIVNSPGLRAAMKNK
jgi:hypothetical protein